MCGIDFLINRMQVAVKLAYKLRSWQIHHREGLRFRKIHLFFHKYIIVCLLYVYCNDRPRAVCGIRRHV